MKVLAVLLAISLLIPPVPAKACGTRLPAVQASIDARELEKLQQLAQEAAHAADAILVGTVTVLNRPPTGTSEFGSVRLSVDETIKGQTSSVRMARWRDKFVYSCQPSAMFNNVGFRPGGKFVVYIRDGMVIRSGAADHLRTGLLTLEQERAIATGVDGS